MAMNRVEWSVTITIGYKDSTAEFESVLEAVKFADTFINTFGKNGDVSVVIQPKLVMDDENKESEGE